MCVCGGGIPWPVSSHLKMRGLTRASKMPSGTQFLWGCKLTPGQSVFLLRILGCLFRVKRSGREVTDQPKGKETGRTLWGRGDRERGQTVSAAQTGPLMCARVGGEGSRGPLGASSA